MGWDENPEKTEVTNRVFHSQCPSSPIDCSEYCENLCELLVISVYASLCTMMRCGCTSKDTSHYLDASWFNYTANVKRISLISCK